jgi:DNA-binding transcriptional MerR regulator
MRLKCLSVLVNLWQNHSRASASVKQIAQKHLESLAQRIEGMQAMQRSLQTLLQHCHGDDRPDCPILDDLSGVSKRLP